MVVILSAHTGPYIEVVEFLDAAPCPRVEVFVDNAPAGTASVTVRRVAAGRDHLVRGAVGASTVGALSRIDFEVPFGVEVVYRAEFFDSAGVSLGLVASDPFTLDVAGTWMHNPLDPQGATRVDFADDQGWSVSRPSPGVVSHPVGRRVGVVLAEPRRGVTGLQLTVRTSTLEDADRVQAMFGDGDRPPVVCVRLGGDGLRLRLPQPLFLSTLNVAELDMNTRWGGGTDLAHLMEGDEVAPPTPGLFVPLLTRADVNAFYQSRNDLNGAYRIRTEVNRDYSIAGYATQ